MATPVQPHVLTRKTPRFLSNSEWRAIRHQYESDPSKPSLNQLAAEYNVSTSLLCKRQATEHWSRLDSIARKTLAAVTAGRDQVVQQAAAQVTSQLAQHITSTLAPWLEREKAKHVKNQILRARKAFARLDNLTRKPAQFSPKDESFISKSVDTWDCIARRNLGLGEGSLPQSSLTLNVLTDHAAVQVVSPNEKQANQVNEK